MGRPKKQEMQQNQTQVAKVIRPQPAQEKFLSSPADIVIYGGAAGGGKSYAILLEPLRHLKNGEFGAVMFRRSMTSITAEGSLYDTSRQIYPFLGAKSVQKPRVQWTFPSGMRVTMAHLQYDDTVMDWHGTQIPLIIFDELCEFSKYQFFYMLSRNRSTCGVAPYIRATCNPDADSWVAQFISWWWDAKTGYAIKERSGVVRYMLRIEDDIKWGNSPEDLVNQYPEFTAADVKSVTFIASTIYDNQELLKANPQYLSNLKALPTVERERLLLGNWKIKPAAGLYFKRVDANVISAIPDDVVKWVRRWDFAATEPSEANPDPDWTAGVLLGKRECGRFIIADVRRVRMRANDVRKLVRNTAASDKATYKSSYTVVLPQDPGQAGKEQAASYVTMLSGYSVVTQPEVNDKVTRAEPFAAQWQAGNIDVLAGDWNDEYFAELESFPEAKHDDQVDGSSGGFNYITQKHSTWDITT